MQMRCKECKLITGPPKINHRTTFCEIPITPINTRVGSFTLALLPCPAILLVRRLSAFANPPFISSTYSSSSLCPSYIHIQHKSSSSTHFYQLRICYTPPTGDPVSTTPHRQVQIGRVGHSVFLTTNEYTIREGGSTASVQLGREAESTGVVAENHTAPVSLVQTSPTSVDGRRGIESFRAAKMPYGISYRYLDSLHPTIGHP